MTADDLAPYVTRPSAAMVLTLQDKRVHLFHEERFPLQAPSYYSEMIENPNVFYMFPEINSAIEFEAYHGVVYWFSRQARCQTL